MSAHNDFLDDQKAAVAASDPDMLYDQRAEDEWNWWLALRRKEGCPNLGAQVRLDGKVLRVWSTSAARWSARYGRMFKEGRVALGLKPLDADGPVTRILWPDDFVSRAKVIV